MSTATGDLTTTPTIETATDGDIVAAAHVYQAAAEALSDQMRARNPWVNSSAREEDLKQAIRVLSTLRASDGRSVIVARLGDGVVGMAAVQIQEPHAHIAFFFVHPDAQNQGVGRRLLDRIREIIDEAGATAITLASSRDPKAWQRYLRFGLYPGPPLLPFRAAKPAFPTGPPATQGITVRPMLPSDMTAVAALDRAVRGADRRDRFAEWLAEGSEAMVALDDEGALLGYAMVSMLENNGQVGPVASTSHAHFPFLFELALFMAGALPKSRDRPWRVDLSARNHLAIGPLLDAGFSAENIVNWFESGPVGQWDRYVFRDEDEL